MAGTKTGLFTVYQIGKNGTSKAFMTL
jgi:hypothetical protein